MVRSRPSCLMLSSTGWAAVTSFQSCWRSEGHTATGWGESTHHQRGGGAAPTGTHAPGWLRTPGAPSLPGQSSLASPKLRQPSTDHAPGNHHPTPGTAPCAGSQGGEAARPPREAQNKAPTAPTESHRAVPWRGGDPGSPHPGTPPQPPSKRKLGARSCTQPPSSNSPRLLMQSRPQTLDGRIRKNQTPPARSPAPFPALPCCREKLQGPPPRPKTHASPSPQARVLTLGQGLQGHGALSRREGDQPLALQV